MEFQSNFILSDEIKQTMGKVPLDQSRLKVSGRFEERRKPLHDQGSLLEGYVAKHRNCELLSCRAADGLEVVFCPSDHRGVWAGLIVKGSLGKRTQGMLEGLAKKKGLI
jgi:hypothetical protein